MSANGNKPHPGGHVRPASKVDVGNYTPTNILVTGGAGFIASHVVIGLVEKYPQYKVVCLDKMDYCSSLHNLDQVKDKPNFRMVKGNLLSADLMNYVLETEQIDTIIHAAAQTHVDNSFGNSFAFTENNVLGTHVLVEAAKKAGIRRFIHVSTDEVYGSSYSEEPSRKEGDVLEPTNPYAATKAAAENIARSYWYSFKMPIIVTRGNNVFGPHQYPEKVIPKFVRRLVNGLPVCIHGDGSNSRHFIFVTDVANAFDTIMHKGVAGEVYNIGCDDEFTNLEAAGDAHAQGPATRPRDARRAPPCRLRRSSCRRSRPASATRRLPRRSRTWRTAPSTTCATTSTRASCRHSAGSARSASRRGSSGASTGTKPSTRTGGRSGQTRRSPPTP
uniref:NAD-dependent epimerase/dehydratase domain-containing protein n=1 Tax=Emiliania huxleyi TaxID=2903 RepID=A0A6V2S3L0_EMIHU